MPKTKRLWEVTPPSLLDTTQERASGEEMSQVGRHLHMNVRCDSRLPGFLISLVMSTWSSEFSSWLSWFLIFFSWQGKCNRAGPPLHPRCPEITHYRWTGRSPALHPAGSQPLPAECGSSAGSVQIRVQDSAPCPSCSLTRDGC